MAIEFQTSAFTSLNDEFFSFNLSVTGNNNYLVVGLSNKSTAATGIGITYGGVPMEKIVSVGISQLQGELWGLKDPLLGSNFVSGNLSAGERIVVGAQNYNGVNTTGATTTNFTGFGTNSITGTLTTTVNNSYIVGIVAHNNIPVVITNGPDITTRWTDDFGSGANEITTRGHDKATTAKGIYDMDFGFDNTSPNIILEVELTPLGGTTGFGSIIGP